MKKSKELETVRDCKRLDYLVKSGVLTVQNKCQDVRKYDHYLQLFQCCRYIHARNLFPRPPTRNLNPDWRRRGARGTWERIRDSTDIWRARRRREYGAYPMVEKGSFICYSSARYNIYRIGTYCTPSAVNVWRYVYFPYLLFLYLLEYSCRVPVTYERLQVIEPLLRC